MRIFSISTKYIFNSTISLNLTLLIAILSSAPDSAPIPNAAPLPTANKDYNAS